jgi:serine protease Do
MPSLAPLVDSVKHSVVNLQVTKLGSGPIFGSAFIIDSNGSAITNSHVIDGASSIKAQLTTGQIVIADLIGQDSTNDIALIQLRTTDVPSTALHFANSDNIKMGDWVLAIGNPMGLGQSVSAGIISQIDATFIHTGINLNHGNSGGPLVDMNGHVIGINTAILSDSNGVGLAVPANKIVASIAQMKRNVVSVATMGFGFTSIDVDPIIAQAKQLPINGAMVVQVDPNSAADEAGLQVGMVIVSVNHVDIRSHNELVNLLGSMAMAEEVFLKVVVSSKEDPIYVGWNR